MSLLLKKKWVRALPLDPADIIPMDSADAYHNRDRYKRRLGYSKFVSAGISEYIVKPSDFYILPSYIPLRKKFKCHREQSAYQNCRETGSNCTYGPGVSEASWC